MKYWFLNLMDKLFNTPQIYKVAPTKEKIVPEKKIMTPYTRGLMRARRNLPNTPSTSVKKTPPNNNPVVYVNNDYQTRDDSLDLLAGAVLAHSLRFEPEPERFTGGDGTFGGAGASGGWEDKSEDSSSSYTPSDNDTSLSCGNDSSE